jgi:hypothetical protein
MSTARQRHLLTGRWHKLAEPLREDTWLHIPLVTLLRWCIRPNVMWRHVPNGEHRDPRTAAKLKAMGVLPGSADLEFHWVERDINDIVGDKRLRRRVLHLELKIGKRPMSIAQVSFALSVRLLGDEYHVAHTVDEAVAILGERGLIRPDVEVCGRRW